MESPSVLFEKAIPVTIKSSSDRQAQLTFRILVGRSKHPRSSKVLQVQISDELDPFFLYSLELDDEDFKSLKVDQCILVDFSVFPHKFIELLEHCLDAKSEDHRFLAVLNVRTGDSTLNVVETNQFKHVNHISLCFRQGNDATVKSYLAARLGDYKGENLDLHQKLQKTLESLENSIKEADKLKEDLGSFKGAYSREVTELTAKHTVDVSRVKEKAMQECLAMKEKLERDRADMECRLRLRADAQESHVSQLDKQLRELTNIRHNLEVKTTEYKTKLEVTEKELEERHQECSSLRKKNVGYDNKLQDYSKQINQHLIRLASLEQEVQAKNDLLSNMTNRLESELSHRAALEIALRDAQAAHERLEEKASASIAEANRHSQAVERLQGELRASKAKVKLKAQVTSQQETLLQERQVTIEKNTADSNFMRQEIASLKSDNDCLRKKVDESKEKLEEMQEMAKSNQQMIQWLNQQLTDSQLAKLGHHSRYCYKSGDSATRGFASQTLSSLVGSLSSPPPLKSSSSILPHTQTHAHLHASSPSSVLTNSLLSSRGATNGSSPVSNTGISKVVFKPPQSCGGGGGGGGGVHSSSATPTTPTPLETSSQTTSVSIYKTDNLESNQRTFTVDMRRKPHLSLAEPTRLPYSSSHGGFGTRTGRTTDEEMSSMSSPVSIG
ncbi:spindle assembly abnormal protein 6 homolog [Selaginella moellendorffii]|uniref:spindle assembly abnormal protein 6 homolog n=1 Tax=Selaginella moellendorffii TaxID=88036 RepID=UPI000D1C3F02|nr:spindle assembly abnormal protein 6 homolog [Selaginella moellendorffii]|eukprot:XP_024541699.1 spindle assembly abnormal protein 6 homolog [Selaginella moellendorffii]